MSVSKPAVKFVSQPQPVQSTPAKPVLADAAFYFKYQGRPITLSLMGSDKLLTVTLMTWDTYTLSCELSDGTPILLYKHAVRFMYPAREKGETEKE